MSDSALVSSRQRWVQRQVRRSVRGVVLATLMSAALVLGLLPVTPLMGNLLLAMSLAFGLSRALRGLWAMRVARHLMSGWSRRHRLRGPGRQLAIAGPVESADRQALRLLTAEEGEPLVVQARSRGLALVDRMEELGRLLGDTDLSAVLRRPLAEERARAEEELEALTAALVALTRAQRTDRDELLQRLAARLEVDRLQLVPAYS